MSYRNIMVHLDREPDAARRLVAARDLASRFEARLIGVAAREPRAVSTTLSDTVDDMLMGAAADEVALSVGAVERTFRDLAGPEDIASFRSGCASPLAFLTRQARVADLVIVGRRGRGDSFDGRFGVDPGALVMGLGRPLLVLPPQAGLIPPRRPLVAWKDTRESRRALIDSLPLLRLSQEVLVLTVAENGIGDQGVSDVVALLRSHGISAASQRELPTEDPAGQRIVDIAKSERVDLIVAGAYGYSRFREWLFGGVTRQLLAEAPAACLFSH